MQLTKLVHKHTKYNTDARSKRRKMTKWQDLEVDWMYQYKAEMSSHKVEHVYARSQAVLKSYWQNHKLHEQGEKETSGGRNGCSYV